MKFSLEYPREFLVHISIDDQRHSLQDIVEADDTITILVETIKYNLRVPGWIT